MASRTARDPMFTPSGPHATSKPPLRGTRLDIGGPAPPNETPAQKVARLREAARRAKFANESQFDRVVAVSRVWADRAHRFTTYSLIGFTAIAGVIATLAIGDMLLYNRKKRNEWVTQIKSLYDKQLAEAQHAVATGTATEEQRKFVEIDQEEEAKKTAKQTKGIMQRTREALFGGYALQEERGGKLGVVGAEFHDRENGLTKDAGSDEGLSVAKAVEDLVQSKKTAHASGGMLDRLPAKAAPQPVEVPSDQREVNEAGSSATASRSWWSPWGSDR